MRIKIIPHILFILLVCYFANIQALCTLKRQGIDILSNHCDVQFFIHKMVTKYHFDAEKLTDLIDHEKISYKTIENFLRLRNKHYKYSTQTTYAQDDEDFDKRIDEGLIYWNKHKKILTIAKRRYHVPPEIIVAIIGKETDYGKSPLNYRALDTLIALSFYNTIRKEYFQNELAQYLLLTRDLNINPKKIKSSFDGGIGIAQFMPSSYRRYAVAYNKHLKPNLMSNDNDAILSVANYLHHFNWQPNKNNLAIISDYNSNPNYVRSASEISSTLRREYYVR